MDLALRANRLAARWHDMDIVARRVCKTVDRPGAASVLLGLDKFVIPQSLSDAQPQLGQSAQRRSISSDMQLEANKFLDNTSPHIL